MADEEVRQKKVIEILMWINFQKVSSCFVIFSFQIRGSDLAQTSLMEVDEEKEEEDDLVPGTPPSKKVEKHTCNTNFFSTFTIFIVYTMYTFPYSYEALSSYHTI